MNVVQVTAEILKREGVDILFTYPLNPLTESAAAARHSAARRAPRARRLRDGRRPRAHDVGRQGRRVLLPARARHRERVRRRRAGLLRRRAARRHRRRRAARPALHEAVLQLVAELPAHHEAGRDRHDARDARAGAAPRVQHRAQRPARAPCSSRSRPTCGTWKCRARSSIAPSRRMLSAPDPAPSTPPPRRWSRPGCR